VVRGAYSRKLVPYLLLFSVATVVAQEAEPEQLIQGGHWKRARVLVESVFRQPGDAALANFLLSQIHYAFGDHAAPLAFAEKAVLLNGHVAKYHRQLAEVIGVQAQHAGPVQQLLLAHRFRKEIGRAIDLDPRDVQARRDLLEFYLLAPGIAGGDPRKAAEVAEQIGALDTPEGFLAQARIALLQKRTSDAEALLRKAARAQPSSYRAQIELARFCLDPDHLDREAAERAARHALDVDRTRTGAYNILAGIYAGRGDWVALDSILKEASQQNPDDLAPYYYAADRLLSAGHEPSRAERYLRTYLSQEAEGNEPGAPDAHWKLGLALEAQGRPAEAVAEWKQSLQLDPASPAAHELKRLRAWHAAQGAARPASTKEPRATSNV
jgi:tetratricopeptide (TPR) repeat protein